MAETLAQVRSIDRDELKAKIDRRDSFVLMETLAPQYFRKAHLPGAVNVPPDRVKELASRVVPNKDTEIVTYCAGSHCHASVDAARDLVALGYTNVRHYAGGKQEWSVAGLPLERA